MSQESPSKPPPSKKRGTTATTGQSNLQHHFQMVQLSNDQLKQLSSLITPKQTEMESQMKILVNKVEKLDKLDGLVAQVANLAKSVEIVHETVNTIKKENVGMKDDIKRIKEENSELKKRVVDFYKREACETIYYSSISVSLTERTQSH